MYRYIYVTSLIYMNTSMPQCNCLCSRDRYRTHFYYLAVESRFYNDVIECLLVDPAAQVRFPPRAVVIFLHPVTFGDQCGIHGLCFGHQDGMFQNNSVVPSRFGTNQFKAGKYVVGIGIEHQNAALAPQALAQSSWSPEGHS